MSVERQFGTHRRLSGSDGVSSQRQDRGAVVELNFDEHSARVRAESVVKLRGKSRRQDRVHVAGPLKPARERNRKRNSGHDHMGFDAHLCGGGEQHLEASRPEFLVITDRNWFQYAVAHYNNPTCTSPEEFHEDMQRFKYLKKLVTQYESKGDLRERLILNHLILLGNVLGPEPLVRILFLRMMECMKVLKPFLSLLRILPARVNGIGKENRSYVTDEIEADEDVAEILRRI